MLQQFLKKKHDISFLLLLIGPLFEDTSPHVPKPIAPSLQTFPLLNVLLKPIDPQASFYSDGKRCKYLKSPF